MPSSKTPAGSAETTSSGNSGGKSFSKKLSLSDAAKVRNADPGGATRVQNPITETDIQASNIDTGSIPKQQDSASYEDNYNSVGDNVSGADSYRKYRELDEPVDSIANIQVTKYNGSQVLTKAFTSFFLQSIDEADQEKYQVVETFSAYYAFFFGRRPPVYTFSGTLINDPKNSWMNSFKYMYDNYFRGTALADNDAQAVISYDKRVIYGYLLGMNIRQDAMNDKGVPFSFTVLVINHEIISFSTDFDAFIKQQNAYMKSITESYKASVSNLKKNVDPTQTLLKNAVLRGNLPASITAGSDSKVDVQPETNKVINSNTAAENFGANSATQISVDGVKLPTYVASK